MATPNQLELLSIILSRSTDSQGASEDEIGPQWVYDFDEDLSALIAEGLVSVVDAVDGTPRILAVTKAGKTAVIGPR